MSTQTTGKGKAPEKGKTPEKGKAGMTKDTQKTGTTPDARFKDTFKLVCVFGATGAQGHSIVESLLKDGNYRIRAVTRDAGSLNAKTLKNNGCEVVECDYTGSVDRIAHCMKGCYAAYLMTNFWDKDTMFKETEFGKKLVDAARQANVKHVLWSTLPNVRKESANKYNVPHFTDKALVDDYLRELQSKVPKAFDYVTFVRPAFYYQNFMNFTPPKLEGDTWVFTIPNIPHLIAFDVDDTGPAVVTAINNPEQWDMKYIDYYGDNMSTEDYIKTWGKYSKKKCRLNDISLEDYGKQSKEMAEMFGWFKEYTIYGKQNTDPKSGQTATEGGLCTWEEHCQRTMKTQPVE